jgi:predicted O-methyltransferase YrrM
MARRIKHTAMKDRLFDYMLRHGVREHPALAALRAETARLSMGGMQIGPAQGALLALLVQAIGARRTLEVGVFTGYSSLAVALALPADGRVVACDVSEDYTARARRAWAAAGVAHKIELRLAPALDTLDALLAAGEAGHFDFAFIDADKTNYDGYYERCLALVRAGGIVAVDNVFWGGRVADPAARDADTRAIKALNAKIAADPRVSVAMLPIADGVTLALKRP